MLLNARKLGLLHNPPILKAKMSMTMKPRVEDHDSRDLQREGQKKKSKFLRKGESAKGSALYGQLLDDSSNSQTSKISAEKTPSPNNLHGSY